MPSDGWSGNRAKSEENGFEVLRRAGSGEFQAATMGRQMCRHTKSTEESRHDSRVFQRPDDRYAARSQSPACVLSGAVSRICNVVNFNIFSGRRVPLRVNSGEHSGAGNIVCPVAVAAALCLMPHQRQEKPAPARRKSAAAAVPVRTPADPANHKASRDEADDRARRDESLLQFVHGSRHRLMRGTSFLRYRHTVGSRGDRGHTVWSTARLRA